MLFAVLIISLILCYFSLRRYGKIFNPFTLEVYIIILFLVVAQCLKVLFVKDAFSYIYSDLVILVYLVSVYIGTCIGIKMPAFSPMKYPAWVNFFNLMLYVALALPLIYYFRNFEISFHGIRMFYETVVFSKFASFFELSKYVLYFIIILRLLRIQKFDFITLALSGLLFLYGSKYAIFDLIIVFFVFFEQFRRLTIRKFVIWGSLAAVMLIGYRFYQSNGENEVLDTAIAYFDIYENQSLLLKKMVNGEHDYYYGEIYFSSFLKYIPRAIWPGKPRRFGFAVLNWDLFPEAAKNGYMPGFGLGPQYADFGFISVFLFGFFSGVIRNTLYSAFLKNKGDVGFLAFVFPLTFITACFVMLQIFVDRFIQRFASRNPDSSQIGENA